jgi:hypothetical protein
MTPITGNTYPVKDKLRALGGRWDAGKKAWMVPDDKAAEARALVAGAPAEKEGARRHFSRCADCGAASQGYYRCRGCNIERRPGGSRYADGQSYHYTDGSGRRQFVLGDDD